MNKLELQLKAGYIKRYHTFPIIGEQTVGQHSYGVAQIVRAIAEDDCSTKLLMAALDHDVAELITGDMPHTAKVSNKVLKDALDGAESTVVARHGLDSDLSYEEKKMLKLADLLEMGFFGISQIRLGNTNALTVVVNVLSAIERVRFSTRVSRELTGHLEGMYLESKR